jgi:hypothetical protein
MARQLSFCTMSDLRASPTTLPSSPVPRQKPRVVNVLIPRHKPTAASTETTTAASTPMLTSNRPRTAAAMDALEARLSDITGTPVSVRLPNYDEATRRKRLAAETAAAVITATASETAESPQPKKRKRPTAAAETVTTAAAAKPTKKRKRPAPPVAMETSTKACQTDDLPAAPAPAPSAPPRLRLTPRQRNVVVPAIMDHLKLFRDDWLAIIFHKMASHCGVELDIPFPDPSTDA